MNKDIAEPRMSLAALLRLNRDLPDGRRFEKLVHYSAAEWSAAKDRADAHLCDILQIPSPGEPMKECRVHVSGQSRDREQHSQSAQATGMHKP
jgi:hypothetical protein